METVVIQEVSNPGDLATVKLLFKEYWASLGFGRETFGFGEELDNLPGVYKRPTGRLALAMTSGKAVGCVALRKLNATSCEMKRLYVRHDQRGKGVAIALLEWLVSQARVEGYTKMMADTLPTMAAALHLYARVGFRRTEPYSEKPTPGAIYLMKDLLAEESAMNSNRG